MPFSVRNWNVRKQKGFLKGYYFPKIKHCHNESASFSCYLQFFKDLRFSNNFFSWMVCKLITFMSRVHDSRFSISGEIKKRPLPPFIPCRILMFRLFEPKNLTFLIRLWYFFITGLRLFLLLSTDLKVNQVYRYAVIPCSNLEGPCVPAGPRSGWEHFKTSGEYSSEFSAPAHDVCYGALQIISCVLHRFCVLPPLKNHPSKAIGFVYSPLWKITVFSGRLFRGGRLKPSVSIDPSSSPRHRMCITTRYKLYVGLYVFFGLFFRISFTVIAESVSDLAATKNLPLIAAALASKTAKKPSAVSKTWSTDLPTGSGTASMTAIEDRRKVEENLSSLLHEGVDETSECARKLTLCWLLTSMYNISLFFSIFNQPDLSYKARDAEWATGLERVPLIRLWAAHIQVAPSLSRWLTPRPQPCVSNIT